MNKRKVTMVAASCALSLSLLVLAPWRSAAAAPPDPRAVGSFFFSFLGLGQGLTVPGLFTLTSDGTLVSVTGSDLGGPPTIFQVKNSATHGVWFRTGPRSVGARALFLNFDQVTGAVVSITRVRIAGDFDKDYDHISGEFFASIFVCPTPFTCPNPVTDTPDIPEPGVGQPFIAVRIR